MAPTGDRRSAPVPALQVLRRNKERRWGNGGTKKRGREGDRTDRLIGKVRSQTPETERRRRTTPQKGFAVRSSQCEGRRRRMSPHRRRWTLTPCRRRRPVVAQSPYIPFFVAAPSSSSSAPAFLPRPHTAIFPLKSSSSPRVFFDARRDRSIHPFRRVV